MRGVRTALLARRSGARTMSERLGRPAMETEEVEVLALRRRCVKRERERQVLAKSRGLTDPVFKINKKPMS